VTGSQDLKVLLEEVAGSKVDPAHQKAEKDQGHQSETSQCQKKSTARIHHGNQE
jgi:hypothetical protein